MTTPTHYSVDTTESSIVFPAWMHIDSSDWAFAISVLSSRLLSFLFKQRDLPAVACPFSRFVAFLYKIALIAVGLLVQIELNWRPIYFERME